MGGRGSGNRWNHFTRPTCEGQTRIDIRYMRRRGLLGAGRSGTLSWSRDGEPAGFIQYRAHQYSLELAYRVRSGDDKEWTPVRQHVHYGFTSQHLGGNRRWFLCPKCGRRCSVLYGGRYFRCRRCWGLAYQSQQEEPMWRAERQAAKLRKRLGGSGELDEEFPEKPKRMHWKTYSKLYRKAERLEGRAADLEAVWLHGLMQSFGMDGEIG